MKSPFADQGTSRAKSVMRWVIALIVWAAAGGASAAEYSFVNIADSTTAGPFGSLTYFGQPASSGATVVFEGGNNMVDGLFTGSGGPLTDIVKTGDAAPAGTFYSFDYAFESSPSIDGGTVAFQAFFNNDHNGGLKSGVFTSDGNSWNLIASTGDAAPNGTFRRLTQPVIAGNTVVFSGSYGVNSEYGLFKHSGGATTTLVKNGDPAPIGEIDGAGPILSDFDGTNFSIWLGYGDPFSAHYNGVFIHDGTELTPIAQSDELAPIGVFDVFDVPAIDGETLAFRGVYRKIEPDSGADTYYEGIFSTNPAGGPLTTVVKAGDPSPLGQLKLENGFMKVIGVVDGQVAFLAEGENAKGILTAGTSGGPLNTVVKTGDMLFGSEVINLFAGRSNDGFLPFNYHLADGRRGIALAIPVPEPHVVWLIAAPILLAGAAQRSRKKSLAG